MCNDENIIMSSALDQSLDGKCVHLQQLDRLTGIIDIIATTGNRSRGRSRRGPGRGRIAKAAAAPVRQPPAPARTAPAAKAGAATAATPVAPARTGADLSGESKIVVSNLPPDVTEHQIKVCPNELFDSVIPNKSFSSSSSSFPSSSSHYFQRCAMQDQGYDGLVAPVLVFASV